MLFTLEELPPLRDLSLDEIHRPEETPSAAAAAMIAAAFTRASHDRHKRPMPEATRLAAVAYADERLALIDIA